MDIETGSVAAAKKLSPDAELYLPAQELVESGQVEAAEKWLEEFVRDFLNRLSETIRPGALDRNSQSVPPPLRQQYELGLQAFDRGALTEALVHFSLLTADEPPLPSVLFNLGVCALHLGYRNEAIKFLRRVQGHSANWNNLRWNLATALLQNGEEQEALSVLHDQMLAAPRDLKIREFAFHLFWRLDRKEQAAELALRLSEATTWPSPWDAVAWLFLRDAPGQAQTLWKTLIQGKSATALVQPEPSERQNPDVSPAPVPAEKPPGTDEAHKAELPDNKGHAELLQRLRDLAESGITEVAADLVNRGFQEGTLQFGDIQPIVRAFSGYSALPVLSSKLDQALLVSGNEALPAALALAAFYCACENGENSKSLQERIVRLPPAGISEVDLQAFLGAGLAGAGHFEQALPYLQSMSARSGTPEAKVKEAAVLDALGEGEQADKLAAPIGNQLIQQLGTNFRLTNIHRDINSLPPHLRQTFTDGLEAFGVGDLSRAIASFDACRSSEPVPYQVYYNLGLCQARLGRFHDAILMFARAREINNQDTSLFANLAAVTYMTRNFQDCRNFLAAYIDIAPGDRRPMASRLFLNSELGDAENALAASKELVARPDANWGDWVMRISLANRFGQHAVRAEAYRQLRIKFFGPRGAQASREEPEGNDESDQMPFLRQFEGFLADGLPETAVGDFLDHLTNGKVKLRESGEIVHRLFQHGQLPLLLKLLRTQTGDSPPDSILFAIQRLASFYDDTPAEEVNIESLLKALSEHGPDEIAREAAANALAARGDLAAAARMYTSVLNSPRIRRRPVLLQRAAVTQAAHNLGSSGPVFREIVEGTLREAESAFAPHSFEGSLPRLPEQGRIGNSRPVPPHVMKQRKQFIVEFEDALKSFRDGVLDDAERRLTALLRRTNESAYENVIRYNLALVAWNQGKLKLAEKEFRRLISCTNRSVQRKSQWNLLVCSYLQAKQDGGAGLKPVFELARKYAQTTIKASPTNTMSYRESLVLFSLAYRTGRIPEAIEYCGQMCKHKDDRFDFELSLAGLLLAANRQGELTQRLDGWKRRLFGVLPVAAKVVPPPPPVPVPKRLDYAEWQRKLQEILQTQTPAEAIAYLRELIVEYPNYLALRAEIASLLAGNQEYREAEEHLQFTVQRSKPELEPVARRNLGLFFLKSGMIDRALDTADELDRLFPGTPAARDLRYACDRRRAPLNLKEAELISQMQTRQQMGQMHVRQFVRQLEATLERAGPQPDAWRIVAMCYDHLDQETEAMAAFERSLDQSSTEQRPKAVRGFVEFCIKWGHFPKAQNLLQEHFAVSRPTPHFLDLNQQVEKGIEQSANPGGRPTQAEIKRNWRRFTQASNPQYDQAVEYFDSLVRNWRDQPLGYEYYARALHANGRTDDALKQLREMCRTFDNEDSWRVTASFCEENQLIDEAVEAYEAVLERNPFSAISRERLHAIAPGKYPSIVYVAGTKIRDEQASRLVRDPARNGSILIKLKADLIKHQHFQQAENAFQTLLRLRPDVKEFQEALAECRHHILGAPRLPGDSTAPQPVPSHALPSVSALIDRALGELPPGQDHQAAVELLARAQLAPPAQRYQLAWKAAAVATATGRSEILGPAILLAAESRFLETTRRNRLVESSRLALAGIQYLSTVASGSEESMADLLILSLRASAEFSRLDDLSSIHQALRGFVQDVSSWLDKQELSQLLRSLCEASSVAKQLGSLDGNSAVQRATATVRSLTGELSAIAPLLSERFRQPAYKTLQAWIDLFSQHVSELSNVAEITLDIDELPHPAIGAELQLPIRVINVARVPARRVGVTAVDGAGYEVRQLPSPLDLVPGGESDSLTLLLAPRQGRRVFDLKVNVSYADIHGTVRRAEFLKVIAVGDPNAPFTPIALPYSPQKAVDDRTSHLFRGREDLLQTICNEVLTGPKKSLTVLYGQRRIGKTSILLKLREILGSQCVAAFVDMQREGTGDRNTGTILYSLAQSIADAAAASGKPLPDSLLPTVARFQTLPTVEFDAFLRAAINCFPTIPILLMIDEAEVLVRKVDQGLVDPAFFDYLRSLIQHQSNLHFLIAGAEQLRSMIDKVQHPLFANLIPRTVSYLDPESARQLVVQPSREAGVEFEEEAIERLLSVTNNHPNFIHILCQDLLTRLNRLRRYRATVGDVNIIIEAYVRSSNAALSMAPWGDGAGERSSDQKLMSLLSALQSGEQTWVSRDAVCRRAEDLGVEREHVDKDLATLVWREVLFRRTPQGGGFEYRFAVPLFLLWVRINHPDVYV